MHLSSFDKLIPRHIVWQGTRHKLIVSVYTSDRNFGHLIKYCSAVSACITLTMVSVCEPSNWSSPSKEEAGKEKKTIYWIVDDFLMRLHVRLREYANDSFCRWNAVSWLVHHRLIGWRLGNFHLVLGNFHLVLGNFHLMLDRSKRLWLVHRCGATF